MELVQTHIPKIPAWKNVVVASNLDIGHLKIKKVVEIIRIHWKEILTLTALIVFACFCLYMATRPSEREDKISNRGFSDKNSYINQIHNFLKWQITNLT